MNISTRQPLKQVWTGAIDNGGIFHWHNWVKFNTLLNQAKTYFRNLSFPCIDGSLCI